MDRESFRTLKLLEALSTEESPTQRELARRLNVSVGLVNSFLKRLAKKGYMKVTTIPANRVRYLLTKEGFREKSRLTYEYLHYSLEFYRRLKEMFGEVYRELEAQGVRRVAFYSPGEVADLAYLHLRGTGLEFSGIFGEGPDDQRFFGNRILPAASAEGTGYDRIIITVLEGAEQRKEELIRAGVEEEKIVILEP